MNSIAILNIHGVDLCEAVNLSKKLTWTKKLIIIKYKFFLSHIKEEQKKYNIWWYQNWKIKKPIEIQLKIQFKNLILIDDVYINKILISNKVSSGEKSHKYLIGYKDDDYKIKPLNKILPQMSGCTRSFY